MGDAFTRYKRGLDRLLELLGSGHPRYPEALTYQQRLQENIGLARRHGDTEELRAWRSRVVEQLNLLALDAIGTSFNSLSNDSDQPTQNRGDKEQAGSPTTNFFGPINTVHSGSGDIHINSNLSVPPTSPLDLPIALLRGAVSRRVPRDFQPKALLRVDDLADAIRSADINELEAAANWLKRRFELADALRALLADPAVLRTISTIDPSAAREFQRRFGASGHEPR
jgi:hypothetical protein